MSEQHHNEKKDRRDPDFELECCEDVQDVLFEYMNRELGDSRSSFVREHLRMCPACQASATEIQATLDMLNMDIAGGEVPESLTEDRRRRLAWAVMHPFLEWIYRHHVVVSWAMVVVVLSSVLLALHIVRLDMHEKLDVTLPVSIKNAPANDLE